METPIPLNERVEAMKFPVALEQTIQKALAKKPADRFQTAAEFAQALKQSIGSETESPAPSSVDPPPVVAEEPAPSVRSARQTQPDQVEPVSRPAGPSFGLLVAVAATFLLLGAVLAMVIMRLIII
jgi:serine/threonine-protein kinase